MTPVLQRWQFANTSVNVFLPPLWRPHHGVAGWCKEIDLVWMTCSCSEGGNLNSSWGTPADICHQVHLANEMQGAAFSTTIPPAFRHAWNRDVSSSHLGELGHARHTAETRLFLRPASSWETSVHSVVRMFPNVCVFKGQSSGWEAVFAFFSQKMGHVDSDLMYSWEATGSPRGNIVSLSILFWREISRV